MDTKLVTLTRASPANSRNLADKLLPLPQPPVRARTDARTNPSAQRATQLRSVLARVYAVSAQNQITTSVP
jgi:cell pole-organizing protein PopZ